MLIDTLRGSKAEKIKKFGLDKITTYGIMAEIKEKRIRDIINYLVLNEYILLTNSEFPVTKLMPKARGIIFDGEQLVIKIAKEEQKEIKAAKQKYSVNKVLFNKLKELRFKLAQEKRVPAFVIFSDASLIDMCTKLPSNDTEFLEVLGVGRVKLQEYGKLFLEVISSFEDIDAPQEAPKNCSLDVIAEFTKKNFKLSEEPVSIRMLADQINANLLQKCDKKITAQKLADYLIAMGYLQLEVFEGKNAKVVTEKGKEIGITTILRTKQNGESYKQNLYDTIAQEKIVDSIFCAYSVISISSKLVLQLLQFPQ